MGIPSLGQKASRSSEEKDVACPFHDPDEEEDAFFAILLLLLLRQTLANHAIFGFGCIPPDWLWRAKRYISTLDGEDNPLINPRGQKMWSVGGEKKRFFSSSSYVPNRGKTTRSVSLLRRIFAPAVFPLSMGAHWARVQH